MNNENEIIIEAGRSEKRYWADLWNFRELLYTLSWRDINVRYKQTVIGFLWAVIRPILTMVVFTVIFGKVAKLPTEGSAPYALMVFSAMLPWQFFAEAVSSSSNSIISNKQLITKVFFPRLIIPMSSVITSFIDFLISFSILILMMVYYHFIPSWNILFLPIFLIIAFLTAMGIGLFITSLNVKYRDFRYIIPFLVQFGLYVSPVGFSSSIIPEKFRLLYSLNPMVGVIDGFRWAILGQTEIYLPGFLSSMIVMILFLIIGVRKFRNMEKTFADII
jgi:lipopolysaccharide transport system permease protein